MRKINSSVFVVCVILITNTLASYAAYPKRPTIAGAYGDLDGDAIVSDIDRNIIWLMAGGLLPYDARADFKAKGAVTVSDWVAIGCYLSGYRSTIPNLRVPPIKLLTPNATSVATPFAVGTQQTFVWGNQPGVTEVMFGFSQNGVAKYLSETFPPTGRCVFTIPTGLQGNYTLTVYGTTPSGVVTDSLPGVQVNEVPTITLDIPISVDRNSPAIAMRNTADQLLGVFRLDILNGESLYAIDFVGGVHQIGGGFLWESEAIRRFEIYELDGKLVSRSERWNVPGANFVLPPEEKPLGPGGSRGLVPTSPVILNRPLLVLVYGTTPDTMTYTVQLSDLGAMKPEDGGNLLNMDILYPEGVSHTVTLK